MPRSIAASSEVDARKERFDGEAALQLLKGKSLLIVAKGKSVKRVDLKKDRPDDESLTAMMLGPTGNLRAPTLVVGKTVLIGFNADVYAEVFGE